VAVREAILFISFGGPEKPEDVMPFLENVTRGRSIPRERLLEVAGHYHHFGGRSPINDQNRALISSLEALLRVEGPHLPVYWGNRNWRPFLADAVRQMAADGITRAYAFVTSPWGSYSGCRQYLENIEQARATSGDGAPEILKLRLYYNHPGFLEPMAGRVQAALEEAGPGVALAFTAHSVPLAMAETSAYAAQVEEASRLVAGMAGCPEYRVVYQSRSGPPTQPWLGPDVLDYLREIAAGGANTVVLAPIGFISDHLEVIYDLDVEAAAAARDLGLRFIRAGTVGTDPRFVAMMRELVLERKEKWEVRRALGAHGPAGDTCEAACCPPPVRPPEKKFQKSFAR
jgi:ferrochelatase